MPNRTSSVTPETILENPVTGEFRVVLRTIATIVFTNVRITSSTITLVVESRWLLLRRGRWLRKSVTIIILLLLDTMVTHHADLVDAIQSTVVADDLDISSCTVSEVVHVFWVECSLEGGKILIRLSLVGMIHFLSFFLIFW